MQVSRVQLCTYSPPALRDANAHPPGFTVFVGPIVGVVVGEPVPPTVGVTDGVVVGDAPAVLVAVGDTRMAVKNAACGILQT